MGSTLPTSQHGPSRWGRPALIGVRKRSYERCAFVDRVHCTGLATNLLGHSHKESLQREPSTLRVLQGALFAAFGKTALRDITMSNVSIEIVATSNAGNSTLRAVHDYRPLPSGLDIAGLPAAAELPARVDGLAVQGNAQLKLGTGVKVGLLGATRLSLAIQPRPIYREQSTGAHSLFARQKKQ